MVIVSFYQAGVHAKECAPLMARLKSLSRNYQESTNNFQKLDRRAVDRYTEQVANINASISGYHFSPGPVIAEYAMFNKDTTIGFINMFFPENKSVSFLKEGEDSDLTKDTCFISMKGNGDRTLGSLGYSDKHTVHLHNYYVKKVGIKEITKEYDWTFFQDKTKLRDTTDVLKKTSGLDALVDKTESGGVSEKTLFNRRNRQRIKNKKKQDKRKGSQKFEQSGRLAGC